MFHAVSPYSPFFTSGLLSSSQTDHADYSFEAEEILALRRGSLPTTGSVYETENDPSAIYPAPHPRRNMSLYRSFLSLDLAESQSLRSASLRRSSRTAASSSARRPISRMSSARFDSLLSRSTPPPKPAPSSTLPELPPFSPDPTFVFGSANSRVTSTISFVSSETQSTRMSTPSSVFTLGRAPKRMSTAATITSSTVSTTYKRSRRADALASLEGRSPLTQPPIGRNFMAMDEEDEEDGMASLSSFSDDDEEEEDWLASTPFIYSEEEDRVLPPSPTRQSTLVPFVPQPTRKPSMRRRSTLESWFPLASFMDVEAKKPRPQSSAPLSGNYVDKWSSFIEITGLS